jgi:DNA-binding transcriptional MerR regulator
MNLPEVLKKLNSEGIEITPRTFEYYQFMGLLPKPVEKRVGKGKRGIYGYFDESIIDDVKNIITWKNQGYTLTQMKERLDDANSKKFISYFKTWKLTDKEMQTLDQGKKKSTFITWKLTDKNAQTIDQSMKESYRLFFSKYLGSCPTEREQEDLTLFILNNVLLGQISELNKMKEVFNTESGTHFLFKQLNDRLNELKSEYRETGSKIAQRYGRYLRKSPDEWSKAE